MIGLSILRTPQQHLLSYNSARRYCHLHRKTFFIYSQKKAIARNAIGDIGFWRSTVQTCEYPRMQTILFPALKNDTEDAKGCNLIHLDAMYDLLNTVYVDASLQSKQSSGEHRTLVKFGRFIA